MRRRWLFVAACVVLAALATGSSLADGASGSLTISGDVALGGTPRFDIEGVGYEQSRCVGGPDGEFEGYYAGAEVELVDERDELVGVGFLEAGYLGGQDNLNFVVCVMTFSVFDVERADEYGVVVDGVELGRFDRDDLTDVGWFVSVEAGN